MRKKTTKIRINGESWRVPRGFGAAYRREVARQFDLLGRGRPGKVTDVIVDLMSLVGYAPTREAIADWPLRKRVEAVVYAANVHARASDNPIQRHPEPEWLRNVVPWCGPPAARPDHIRPDLWGAFAGPTPTEIRA